jgi:hypothetical protein
MTTHKTADLEGALLDRAVGMAEGYEIDAKWGCNMTIRESGGAPSDWSPSTDWLQGGPIIERHDISVIKEEWRADRWFAAINVEFGVHERADHRMNGPTPLIAAMRAYVASKFGDEIDL